MTIPGRRGTCALVLTGMLAAGCGEHRPVSGMLPVPPDTQTVDGVLQMRHDADAFARAPQWTLDSAPLVVFDGGDSAAFRLDASVQVIVTGDGRMLALANEGNARLLVFNANGSRARVIMRSGKSVGGNFRSFSMPYLIGDTVIVLELHHARTALHFDLDGGLIRVDTLPGTDHDCMRAVAMLPGARIIAQKSCWEVDELPTSTARLTTPVMSWARGSPAWDTVVVLPGSEMADPIPPRTYVNALGFGRSLELAAWDSMLVTANGDPGYQLQLRSPAGQLMATIAVDVRSRPVVRSAREHDSTRRGGDPRRYASRHPPHGRVLAGADGVLWVMDTFVPGDSTWTATAFQRDGAIVGRLSGRAGTSPLWFGSDRVLIGRYGDGMRATLAQYTIRKPTAP